jgi:hypothetical protein
VQPYGYGYEPPSIARGRPPVIAWFRVYAATCFVFYVGFVAIWLYFTPGDLTRSVGVSLIAVALGAVFGVGTFVPYKPWGWTLGLVAISLGLVSCTLFVAVPLLVAWMQPETKAAFGRL